MPSPASGRRARARLHRHGACLVPRTYASHVSGQADKIENAKGHIARRARPGGQARQRNCMNASTTRTPKDIREQKSIRILTSAGSNSREILLARMLGVVPLRVLGHVLQVTGTALRGTF